MDSVFVTATFASIAPWMALMRATQEQLPVDAGVELTGTYLQRVAVANTGFMSAPKLGPVNANLIATVVAENAPISI